jgi:two-component system, chemotaxis family, sensor kinase Cph1
MKQQSIITLNTGETVDLSQCDQEPIHIPGSIQPHGVMLVLRETDFTIVQVSKNIQTLVEAPPEKLLNSSLDDIAALSGLKQALPLNSLKYVGEAAFTYRRQNTSQEMLIGRIVRQQEMLIVEIAACAPELRTADNSYEIIQETMQCMGRVESIQAFSEIIVEQVRRLTGYDRVMVYRFDEDNHGSVIAEAVREDLASYLEHHFPASDIPIQARALYIINTIREIPDVAYSPVPLVPELNPETNAPLDLSRCYLRSVSPIHIQYLVNMGVQASMSLSLVKDNRLWGMIACHHRSPRQLSYGVRTGCEFIARFVSSEIINLQDREQSLQFYEIESKQKKLIKNIIDRKSFTDGLLQGAITVADLIECGGAAICIEDAVYRCGSTPDDHHIRNLTQWLLSQEVSEYLMTNSLRQVFPEAEDYKAVASGLLAVVIPDRSPLALMWFRPEVVQTIKWGGNPRQSIEVMQFEEGKMLTPRKSFDTWQETVQATSIRWRNSDCRVVVAFKEQLAQISVLLRKEL